MFLLVLPGRSGLESKDILERPVELFKKNNEKKLCFI